MVKGISRQVILVQAPDPKLFEQAIFILKEEAVRVGITDEMLLKEARKVLHEGAEEKKRHLYRYGAVWAGGGAALMGLVWLASFLL